MKRSFERTLQNGMPRSKSLIYAITLQSAATAIALAMPLRAVPIATIVLCTYTDYRGTFFLNTAKLQTNTERGRSPHVNLQACWGFLSCSPFEHAADGDPRALGLSYRKQLRPRRSQLSQISLFLFSLPTSPPLHSFILD